ncbi:MAG: thiamine pyrophosphate-dependent enzyme [Patescibacteria group bacterium]
MTTINEELNGHTGTWCPGCGDWGISLSIKRAFTELNLDPSSVVVMFDIGCSGNMNDVLNAYAMHTLHGRSIPPAMGVKLANHTLPVVCIGGDGAIFGEGGNHFLHACRGNHDITVIMHDNSVYGLTTGQVAPTALHGAVSKSTPQGVIEIPINPLHFAIQAGAGFVAQSFAGDTKHVTEMIKQGIAHKGFSFVNVLQPCVTFNKVNTYQYYAQRTYKLDETHEKSNFRKAISESINMTEEKYPLGVIYEDDRPAYHQQIKQLSADQPLVAKERFTDFQQLLNDFE